MRNDKMFEFLIISLIKLEQNNFSNLYF